MQTTIRVDVELRDELAAIAERDYDGASLSQAIARLVKEHRRSAMVREMRESYARLQASPDEWADYLREGREWDAAELGEIPT